GFTDYSVDVVTVSVWSPPGSGTRSGRGDRPSHLFGQWEASASITALPGSGTHGQLIEPPVAAGCHAWRGDRAGRRASGLRGHRPAGRRAARAARGADSARHDGPGTGVSPGPPGAASAGAAGSPAVGCGGGGRPLGAVAR